MNSDNPVVFYNFTYQDVSCCMLHNISYDMVEFMATVNCNRCNGL